MKIFLKIYNSTNIIFINTKESKKQTPHVKSTDTLLINVFYKFNSYKVQFPPFNIYLDKIAFLTVSPFSTISTIQIFKKKKKKNQIFEFLNIHLQ